MKIVRLINDHNQFRCFEVDNRLISRDGVARVVSKLEGVSIIHSPNFYDDEVFCKFTYKGFSFKMTEPYGDSSVYDVIAPEHAHKELEEIAKHFEQSEPIKSGDSGHNAFFIINCAIGTFIWIAILSWIFIWT